MATKNPPTLKVKYSGMKEEKIFNIRALNNLHRIKLVLGVGEKHLATGGGF
jgi:hypothetical protein